MGVIKYLKTGDEVLDKAYLLSELTKIDIENWRCIGYFLKETYVTVVTKEFREFKIENCSVSEVILAASGDEMIEKSFSYQRNVLACTHCFGTGKTDWVSKATGKNKLELRDKGLAYERDKSGAFLIFDDFVTLPTPVRVYSSIPVLDNDSVEICGLCSGSGLNILKDKKGATSNYAFPTQESNLPEV